LVFGFCRTNKAAFILQLRMVRLLVKIAVEISQIHSKTKDQRPKAKVHLIILVSLFRGEYASKKIFKRINKIGR
jgi:hypothetical protein